MAATRFRPDTLRYDAAGRLPHDVRLYDQTGAPLGLGLAFDATKQQTLDSSGRRVDNAFPTATWTPATGVVTDVNAAPPVEAPPLLAVPTPTPTPSPAGGKR